MTACGKTEHRFCSHPGLNGKRLCLLDCLCLGVPEIKAPAHEHPWHIHRKPQGRAGAWKTLEPCPKRGIGEARAVQGGRGGLGAITPAGELHGKVALVEDTLSLVPRGRVQSLQSLHCGR